MSWVWVGVGAAVGATAGAISGSRTGGDDVWKQALGGAALGGAAGGAGYAAFGAEAAAPAVVAGEGGAGLLEAGGSGLALGGAGLETGGAMAGGASGAGIVGAEGAATGAGAGGMGLGQAGGFGSGASFGGSGASFGTYGGAAVPEGGGLMNAGFAPGMQAPVQMVQAPAATEYAMFGGDTAPTAAKEYAMWGGDTAPAASNVANNIPKTPDSPFKQGILAAKDWLSEPKNAMLTGVLGLGALSMFNNDDQGFEQPNVTQAGYPLSPNFKPSRYQPTRTYARGGDVYGDYDGVEEDGYAEGGKIDWSRRAQQFAAMTQAAQAPETKEPGFMSASKIDPSDTGVFIDRDVETMDQPAHTAAQIRMQRLAKKYGVSYGPKTEEKEMAEGGITSLGGYAHGGNPRLLRGPGDGMSDDIPATIADKQPARLADGEFVVPADVVSGLGNGSTEAGAKKLHQMMDKVRVDRTGTKKQGKQIKADKYIPGMASGGITSYADGGSTKKFDPAWYLQQNPDVAAAGMDPRTHFYTFGMAEGRAPYEGYEPAKQGYNPDYYNPQYYQSQANTLQDRLASQNQNLTNWQNNLNALNQQGAQIGQQLGGEGQTITGTPGQQVAYGANGRYAYGTIGENGTLDLSNAVFGDPIVGTYKYGYAYNPQGYTPEQYQQAQNMIGDINTEISKTQGELSPVQQNIARLEQSGIKYDPYTIANRPSSAEPQFYGNIYKPEYENYARPGYDMNAQLGVWNNEYGGNAAPTQRPQNIDEYGGNAAPTQRVTQPKEENKARKGGILAAKR